MAETMKAISISDNAIEMTEDYTIFKTLAGNRPLDIGHVNRLMIAMRKNDLFVPIMINSRLEVIDGQHRLEARRQLGLIVPFFICGDYGLREVQAINSGQKSWTVNDFTESCIKQGKKDYEIYKWFRAEYKLTHLVCCALLAGVSVRSRELTKIFNEGTFKVTHLEYAKGIAKKFEQIAPFFKGYVDRNFVCAMMGVMEKKVFDFKKFIRKLTLQPNALSRCASVDQYIDLIESIFNRGSQTKVSLKYSEWIEMPKLN